MYEVQQTPIWEILLVGRLQKDLKRLEVFIRQWQAGSCYGEGLKVKSYHSFKESMVHIEESRFPDAVILDIPDGIEFAQHLRSLGFEGPIVFLSPVNAFAVETYSVNAFSFLLKPVDENQIFPVLDDLGNTLAGRSDSRDIHGLIIRTRTYIRKVLYSELVYMEVFDHKIYFHINNEDVLVAPGPLYSWSLLVFRDPRFAKCHNSIIVNMDFISSLGMDYAILRSGEKLPIARRCGVDFKSRYYGWEKGRQMSRILKSDILKQPQIAQPAKEKNNGNS
jgi:DNA-binding LytR/AlgR family response regulator